MSWFKKKQLIRLKKNGKRNDNKNEKLKNKIIKVSTDPSSWRHTSAVEFSLKIGFSSKTICWYPIFPCVDLQNT